MQPDDGRNMPPLRMTAPQGRQDCDEQDRCAGGQQAIRATGMMDKGAGRAGASIMPLR
jgi:hypothetical protein